MGKPFFFILSLALGCCKPDPEKDCLKEMLKQNGMAEYKNQDPGCNSFLQLYKLKGRQYFVIGNHCADMVSYPVDCEGKNYCENRSPAECDKFYEMAAYIGIAGIQNP